MLKESEGQLTPEAVHEAVSSRLSDHREVLQEMSLLPKLVSE